MKLKPEKERNFETNPLSLIEGGKTVAVQRGRKISYHHNVKNPGSYIFAAINRGADNAWVIEENDKNEDITPEASV